MCRSLQSVFLLLLFTLSAPAVEPRFTVERSDSRLEIKLDNKPIGTYLFKHDKLTRPGWIHLRTPSGVQVTRNFPPRAPEDLNPGAKGKGALDHPDWHPGLWMSFGHLDGEDYWRCVAPTVHDGFVERPTASKNEIRFTVRNRYLRKNRKSEVCVEQASYTLRVIPEGLLLLTDSVFRSDRDFYFGDQEESGLAVRVAAGLRVKGGNGSIVNDRGEKNGSGTWGKETTWADYSGVVSGKHVGVLVVPSPDNARKCWLHSRDYGVMVFNPFPRQPKERAAPYVKTVVKKGSTYRLRFAVLLHESGTKKPIDRKAAVAKCLSALKNEGE